MLTPLAPTTRPALSIPNMVNAHPPYGPLKVLIALENNLDREAYAARIARDPRFVPSTRPGENLAFDVRLVDRCGCAATDAGPTPPTVLMLREQRPAVCCCCSIPRTVGWSRLLDALAHTAGDPAAEYFSVDDELDKLTPRERDVLRLVGLGMTVPQSATELGLSASTVGNHKHRLMRKLKVRTSLQLLRIALRNGLADLE